MRWIVYGARRLLWWLGRLRRRLRRPPPWVAFLIEAPPPQLPGPRGPWWRRFLGRPPPLSLTELAGQLRTVARDPRVRGVILHLRPIAMAAAQAEALAELVRELRAAGKRVVCWAPEYTVATYRIACGADEVLLQAGGTIGPLGLHREYAFLADALGRFGVEGDFVQVSPYKTAADMLTRSEFSAEAREMAGWLAEGAFADTIAILQKGRRVDEDAARRLVDATPCTDLEALELGAVDAIVGEEELTGRIGGAILYWHDARRRLFRLPPVRPGKVVGVIRVEGLIVDGRSRRPPMALPVPLLLDPQCGDLTVVQQARKLATDRRVAAVVLWIDSRGGSASASESMATALEALARRKPLVAAMGPVAASGGYYVATPAARIFAQPGTITGSIGVLAGKVVARGLLDLLLVRRESVTIGEHSAMYALERPFSEADRLRLRAIVDRGYRLFLERVARSRHRALVDVEPLAGGRVWTGRQALAHGLVDELGGFDQALAEARRLGGLRADAAFREAGGGGRQAPPAQSPAPAAAEHARAAVRSLNRAGAWMLCPWWFKDEG